MRIITHNGRFHADEVFSCMVIQTIHPECTIVRSRSPEIIASGDYVVDVGGVHDERTLRFDHHQFSTEDTEYGKSSAGLVWDTFGELYLAHVMSTVNASAIDTVNKLVVDFIRQIDAADIGVARSSNEYSISNVIANMNPYWDEARAPDIRFAEAIAVMRSMFEAYVLNVFAVARLDRIVSQASQEDGVFIFRRQVPWKRFLDSSLYRKCSFVVLPVPVDGVWIAKSIPKRGEYGEALLFPKRWAGRADVDLSTIASTSNLVRCSDDRRTVVALNKTAAIKAAKRVVALRKKRLTVTQ